MTTKMTVSRPGGGGVDEYEVDDAVEVLSRSVNIALKRGDKFVSIKQTDGKKCSIVATNVVSIWEE